MSDACCGDAPARAEVGAQEEVEQPWWRDRAVVLPILSGVFLAAGLLVEWLAGTPAARIVALVLFWLGLLAGASTFVPGALRNLVRKRKLGIGLLMTISAVGAVILGYVEEAAALAFLYSLAEMLEDKAMDRARSGLRALLKLVPETATVARGGRTVTIPAREHHHRATDAGPARREGRDRRCGAVGTLQPGHVGDHRGVDPGGGRGR